MENTRYVLYNLSPEALASMGEQGIDQQHRGPRSLKQQVLKAAIYMAALPRDLSIFAHTLWQCALTIAEHQRNQQELKSREEVVRSLAQEEMQICTVLALQHASERDIAYRLANKLYYHVQLYALDGAIRTFIEACEKDCKRAALPLQVALCCASVKMLNRSRADKKDAPSEFRDIEVVLQAWRTAKEQGKPFDGHILTLLAATAHKDVT